MVDLSEKIKRQNRYTLILVIALFLFMVGLSCASVPLYRLFCQKTGYGGTPRISYEKSVKQGDRVITVRFNADVYRGLPWKFKPLQTQVQLKVGETGLAFYQVKNLTSYPVIGMAVYNVTPDKAAIYFNKVACFCFEEQTIGPYEKMDMPVQFFIDPEIVKDPNLEDVHTITLSYTFFHLKEAKKFLSSLPVEKK